MERILSGIQPTGNLHIGNYFGAIKNWVGMQTDNECLFCVVDLHAITVPQDPVALRANIRETAAAFIAGGIDPKKSAIFAQSAVSGHAELGWILGCFAQVGWLNRMTQFKEKAGKKRDLASVGLYTYPVLMAADILVYKATQVPVGEDQKQHLELARDVAGAFNRFCDADFFPLPEPKILGPATRVMSLRDGTKKMSKSEESDYSRINLNDDADAIARKVRKAKTDPEPVPTDKAGAEGRPEALNLMTLYAACTSTDLADVFKQFGGQSFADFKKELTDAMVAHLGPIHAEFSRLKADTAHLDGILKAGAETANAIANKTIAEVKESVGLWS